jgi:glutamine amidotransferase-like uncharacterized protein
LGRPYLEKTHYKKGQVLWAQGVSPEFKPQYCKKKKKKRKKERKKKKRKW